VFSHIFATANLRFISILEVEFTHKSDEYKEKLQLSSYFNSQSLLTLKSHNHNKERLILQFFTINFSHLYKEISHSTFFL
jgi:hypothetical protein